MKSDHLCFTFISVVTITLTITYKNLYPSRYTQYQEYLFNRIEEYQGKAEGTREDHKLYKMKIPKSLQKKILSESQKFTKKIDEQTQRLVA